MQTFCWTGRNFSNEQLSVEYDRRNRVGLTVRMRMRSMLGVRTRECCACAIKIERRLTEKVKVIEMLSINE